MRLRRMGRLQETLIPNRFGAATSLAILFLAWSGLSLLWTPAPHTAIAYYLNYVVQFFISYMLCRLYPIHDVFRNVSKGTAYAAAVSTPLIILITGYTGGRLAGDTGLFSTIATSACLGIIAVLYLRLHFDISKSVALLFVLSMLVALYLTFAKTELIALAMVGMIYAMLAPGSKRRRAIRMFWMLLVIAAALISFSTKIADYQNRKGGMAVETLTGRTILWTATYQKISTGPFMRGFGLLAFRETGPTPILRQMHAHNEFLQIWFNFGLVGVVLVFGSYFALAHTSIKAWRQKGGVTAVLVLCTVVWCLIKGITESVPAFTILPILWLLLFDCLVSTHIAMAGRDSNENLFFARHP
jgi:exopolysaccharide production protein ExoQ